MAHQATSRQHTCERHTLHDELALRLFFKRPGMSHFFSGRTMTAPAATQKMPKQPINNVLLEPTTQ
jgi:hypothetical protein